MDDGFTPEECEHILRAEVAPVFAVNLWSPAGEWQPWSGAGRRQDNGPPASRQPAGPHHAQVVGVDGARDGKRNLGGPVALICWPLSRTELKLTGKRRKVPSGSQPMPFVQLLLACLYPFAPCACVQKGP